MTRFVGFLRFALCTAIAILALICVLSAYVRWKALSTTGTTATLFVESSRIEVVAGCDAQLPMDNVLGWVRAAAGSVSNYYGHFPVSSVAIHLTPFRGKGIPSGRAFATDQGGRITIRVGNETSAAQFAADWTLTHEMLHLAFPSVEENRHWIEEGMATYVEPIARLRAGHLAPEKMWADLVRDMPQGLPEKSDRGLDHTHTWGRTYWGGALFCLLADVEIRRQTKNKKGLDHALRAILEAGGDIRHEWDLAEALRVGDSATGTRVLQNLYEEMKDKPVDVDLEGLWADLGVHFEGQELKFDEDARFAAIRRAITTDSQSVEGSSSSERPTAILAGRTR